MIDHFSDLNNKLEIVKARIYFFSAFICSFIFYYFMTHMDSQNIDFFAGRVVIALIALGGLIVTYAIPKKIAVIRLFLLAITVAYLGLYLHLLIANHWSVFHRWSYFVVAAILCGSALTWQDFIFNTIIGLLTPLLFSYHAPLSSLELIHFHSANAVTILIIGLSVRSHFRYRTEAALLSKSLVEKSKMAVLGEMAAGVSHEINNPLAVVITSNEQLKRLVEKEQFEPKKILDLIDKINRMTLRISKIVIGLKEFSSESYEEEENEPVNLNEIVLQSLKPFEEKFNSSGVKIKFLPEQRNLFVNGKKNKILEAVTHLISNAYDACSNESEPTITISLGVLDNFAKLTVADNGPGVPEELISKIMQPFFTTKDQGAGQGMGLSITHGIAQKHGGKLYLNKDESLSSFTLLLPFAKS